MPSVTFLVGFKMERSTDRGQTTLIQPKSIVDSHSKNGLLKVSIFRKLRLNLELGFRAHNMSVSVNKSLQFLKGFKKRHVHKTVVFV